MPNVLPTIPQEPAQGIQALLDTVYLWNPDVANNLIEQVNELLEELGELSNISGAIKPYSQLEAPVRQYMPMSYNDGVYVANEEMTTLPATPDLSKWTLIATKVDEQALEQQISRAVGGEADLRQQADTALQGNIDAEERARIAADQGLQTQIDAISAASDVKDIVGTYQELENYDTSTLGNNDIIKVLQDETQEDATTYYRWVAAEDEFQLIGEEGPYYTRAQTDAMLEEKQDIMQFSTMPESAEYQNRIIEYTGETREDAPASATAEQTVGSGLSNVAVNLETFEEKENPVDAETVSFVCTSRTSPELDVTPNTTRLTVVSVDADGFEDAVIGLFGFWVPSFANGSMIYNGDFDQWTLYAGDRNYTFPSGTGPEVIGVVISGEPMSTDGFTYVYTDEYPVWEKDDEEVDLAEYGVTYNGNPDINDEITISYTPEVVARTKGYFYASAPVLEPAQATVAQTVGGDSLTFETVVGDMAISGTPQALVNLLSEALGWTPADIPSTGTITFTRSRNDDVWVVEIQSVGWSDTFLQSFLEDVGFVFSGMPAEGDAIVGNYVFSLSDLSINTAAFIEAEHPTGDTTVDFVATVYNEFQLSPTSFEVEGGTLTVDPDTFLQAYRNSYGDPDNVYLFEVEVQSGSFYMMVYYTEGNFDTWIDPAEFGFSYTGDLSELTTTTICNINCTEPGAHWYKNGSLVDIAEYGISYDREPQDGDTITVTYTAPFISGYAWEQIDVQPGGGAGGIKWAGQWDKPASTTWSYYYPHYIFPTLPDGNYELVVQNKSLYQYSSGIQVWSHKTFKITFGVANHRARGITAWVLDGNTDFYNYNMSSTPTFTHWSSYYETPSLDRIVADIIGACRIGNATMRASDIEGIFRWTNIKNTDTGEEVPVEIDVRQNPTGYGNQIGSYNAGSPVDPPYIPAALSYSTGDCNDSTQYVMFGDTLLPQANTVARCGSFEIVLKDADGSEWRCVVENNMYSYIARVLKASGIFVNTQLGWTEGVNIGGTCVFLNTPAGTEKTIEMWVSLYGSTVSANCWLAQSVSSFAPALITRPGSSVTMDNFGLIEQYTGETDANYTNGYFYKATGTTVNVPESIAITNITTDGEATITIDLENWIDAVSATYGWTPETIRNWLTDYAGTTWNLSCRTDNGEVTRMYIPWFGDTYEPDILQCVTATYTGDQHGEVWVDFQVQYSKAHTEIQNGHWEQVDVQPSGATYTAGNGISIDSNNEISVADPVLVNKAGTFAQNSIAIGATTGTSAARTNSVQIGYNSFASGTSSTNVVCVGADTRSSSYYGIAIGSGAQVGSNAAHATQIGSTGSTTTNSDANTFKVGNANGNYEIMSADGTIPADRLTHAINKHASMPTAASTNEGWIVQYTGTTDATYTHGYIYECVGTTAQGSATATQTTGSSLADLAVNVATFETQVTTTGSYVFVFDGMDWHLDTITGEIVDVILDYGITFTGTPASGDAITVDYTAGGTTYAWTQTSVQPTSGGLPSQTGNAGKFLITDGTNASWGYAVTQILIPDTTSNTRWNIGRFGFGGELVITQPHFGSSARLDLYLAYNAVYSAKQGGATLGTSAYSWNNVFTQKINNGNDIDVPTTGGTMVVATPPTTPNTTWALKATVDANGDHTVAWVQES